MKPRDLPRWRERFLEDAGFPGNPGIMALDLYFVTPEAFAMSKAMFAEKPENIETNYANVGIYAIPTIDRFLFVLPDRSMLFVDSDYTLQARLDLVEEKSYADDPKEFDTMIAIAFGFELLLNQRETVAVESIKPPTYAQKDKRKRKRDTVTVVNLARKHLHVGRVMAEGSRNWEHRWIVRGHWREQPYGPNRSERRRVWIAPYIKGPEGKPMIENTKVYTYDA